ncbi:hypothetical protein TrRE_jg1155, partial [Triparma retinervis]
MPCEPNEATRALVALFKDISDSVKDRGGENKDAIPPGTLEKLSSLLEEGADAGFVEREEGVWGAYSSSPLLCLLLNSAVFRTSKDGGIAAIIVEKMLAYGASISSMKGSRDWRGSGSEKSVFDIGLRLRKGTKTPATLRVMKLMLKYADEKTLKPAHRSISSMRSDGYESSNFLHETVQGLSSSSGMALKIDEFKLIVDKFAELKLLNAPAVSSITNERGWHTNEANQAIHFLLKNFSKLGGPAIGMNVCRTRKEYEGEVERVKEEMCALGIERKRHRLEEWEKERDLSVKAAKMRERALVLFKERVETGELKRWKAGKVEERAERKRERRVAREARKVERVERRKRLKAEKEERRAAREARKVAGEAVDSDIEDEDEDDNDDSDLEDEDEDDEDDNSNFDSNFYTFWIEGWYLDNDVKKGEVDVDQYSDDAKERIEGKMKTYRCLIRCLALLLDAGADVNSISETLLSTDNEEWKEGGDDDPREEGYVYKKYMHLQLDGALGLIMRKGRGGQLKEEEFQALSNRSLGVTSESLCGMIEVVYMLRLKGLDQLIGSACDREVWDYSSMRRQQSSAAS